MKEEGTKEFYFDASLIKEYVPPASTGDELDDAVADLQKYRDWKQRKDMFEDWLDKLCRKSTY